MIPSMLYGVQVLSLSDDSIDILEKEHRSYGKRIQSLPITTSNAAAYRLLGWKSIRAYVDLAILTFFYKTLLLNATCIFRQLVTRRFIDICMSDKDLKGPTSMFVITCKKYGILQHIEMYVDTGNGLQLNEWKQLCKQKIAEREYLLYHLDLCMSEKLANMQYIQQGMHQWWKVAHAFPESLSACGLMVKLLIGEEPLNWNLGRYIKPRCMQNRTCKLCTNGAFETIKHFLFECSALCDTRASFLSKLYEVCLDGEQIVMSKDYKGIIAANINVGTNYKAKLKLIAEAVMVMFSQHQRLLRDT